MHLLFRGIRLKEPDLLLFPGIGKRIGTKQILLQALQGRIMGKAMPFPRHDGHVLPPLYPRLPGQALQILHRLLTQIK